MVFGLRKAEGWKGEERIGIVFIGGEWKRVNRKGQEGTGFRLNTVVERIGGCRIGLERIRLVWRITEQK